VSSLIVPEEVPSTLPLIYSKIPPIKKGTDSRLGIGFRFGEHADFQIIMELGPQYETTPLKHPLSKEETKRKREAIMYSALKGELGPWTQTIAERQEEQKNKKLRSRQKLNTDRLPKINGTASGSSDGKDDGNNWLSSWSKGHRTDSQSIHTVEQVTNRKNLPRINRLNVVDNQPSTVNRNKSTQSDMKILRILFGNATTLAENNN
ncbi:hypothetical protein QAD02_008785, partial [Eretmocerus hayati]